MGRLEMRSRSEKRMSVQWRDGMPAEEKEEEWVPPGIEEDEGKVELVGERTLTSVI